MKRYKLGFFVCILTFLFAVNLFGQAPDTLWTKTLGTAEDEGGNSVIQTSDGGYIIAGYSTLSGSADYWLVKTDSLGVGEWGKIFGSTGIDKGYSVVQTSDSGYVIVGFTNSYGAGAFDIWAIKTDKDGNTEWNYPYGGAQTDYGYSIDNAQNDGFIIVGSTKSFGAGGYDVYLVRTTSFGVVVWTKTFGYGFFEEGRSVQYTSDGGYIIAGTRGTIYNGLDIWLIKTDSLGNQLWSKTFGGDSTEYGYSVKQTTDGGYIVAGYTESFSASDDIWLIKTDSLGNEEWNSVLGGNGEQQGYSVAQTPDGGYIVVGETYQVDLLIIRTDDQGNEVWTKQMGGSGIDRGSSVAVTADAGYIIAGSTSSYGAGGSDIWLIKLGPDTGVEEGTIRAPTKHQVNACPNPFTNSVEIRWTSGENLMTNDQCPMTISIYDVSGKLVRSFSLLPPHSSLFSSVVWNGKDLSGNEVKPGIYFLKTKGCEPVKMVKLR